LAFHPLLLDARPVRDHPADDDSLVPSRSQQRRDALAVLALAQRLVALGDAALDRLPLPDGIRAAVDDTKRIRQQIAHKRRLQYLAKRLRREDEETLDAIRQALEPDREQARRDTALLHRIEAWRERLIEDPDGALGELVEDFPDADR